MNYRLQELHLFFARTVERGFGQIVEQSVGFAIEQTIALLDGSLSDGLS